MPPLTALPNSPREYDGREPLADAFYIGEYQFSSANHVQIQIAVEREGREDVAMRLKNAQHVVDAIRSRMGREVFPVYREPTWLEKWDAERQKLTPLIASAETRLQAIETQRAATRADALAKLTPTGDPFVLALRFGEVRNRVRELGLDHARPFVMGAWHAGRDEVLAAIFDGPYGVLDGVGVNQAFIDDLRERVVDQRVGTESANGREAHHLRTLIKNLEAFRSVGTAKDVIFGSAVGR